MSQTVISKELLLKLYKQADEETKDKIEKEYPDYFSGLYKFDNELTITLNGDRDSPLAIAKGYAPSPDLKHRCLMVTSAYRAEIFDHHGRQFIKFHKI
jgi:ABC-type branched-subunit amino acid transport system ATPase component